MSAAPLCPELQSQTHGESFSSLRIATLNFGAAVLLECLTLLR